MFLVEYLLCSSGETELFRCSGLSLLFLEAQLLLNLQQEGLVVANFGKLVDDPVVVVAFVLADALAELAALFVQTA